MGESSEISTGAGSAGPPSRIVALDVLRGVAICGILLMTICKMGGVTASPIDRFPPALDAQWIGWSLQTLLVDGTMRGLFTLLFGASMVLMLRRADDPGVGAGAIDVWARRCLALMAFGVVEWLVFLWPGEILWTYGVSGFALLAFRRARPAVLVAVAALLLTGLSANAAYRTYGVVAQAQAGRIDIAAGRPDTEAAQAARAIGDRLRPNEATRTEAIAQRTHWLTLLRWSERFWLEENIGGTGWLEVAESIAFMLLGMALFRTGVLTGTARHPAPARLMIAGYALGLPMRMLAVWLGWTSGLDISAPVAGPALWALSDTLFQPGRLLVTLGHAGLILSLLQAGWLGRADTLRALGRMALSVYALQAILGSLIFYAGGLVGRFALPGLWGVALVIWLLTAAFSRWWLARYEMGPAEAMLRGISRGRAAWPVRRRGRGSDAPRTSAAPVAL
ncbi:hypothetical protein ASE86_11890 [Sphingomonas sp. Leaf33]|uniref:DUF418 domain-containing protein n=1 Tax=Sphingomonas sp. Leaf33 TaxID=1736215 RepID=UPI0006F95E12|nr:DUF418 domain-containing protein [Sphingomonas sp. Leaf33]KQN19220.1 hypothetical protein ASE86_11890 [Sphingomonas sp. Leaf33]